MDTRDSNNVNMIETTIQYCDDNAAVLAPIPAAPPLINTIKAKLTLIDQYDQIVMGTSTGVTLDTNLLRSDMENKAFKCGSATLAYATSINNNTLKALVNWTIPKLNALKKEEVDDVCQTIRDATNTNFAGATPFGIVAADVTALQTAINAYRNSSQNPREAIIAISGAVSQIKILISDIVETFLRGQLDQIVNTLTVTNPPFVEQYYFARQVIDAGTTHTKLRGSVFLNPSDPAFNADVILYTAGTPNIAYQTKSDAEGKLSITPVEPNLDYDLRITFPAYQDYFETNIHFSPGEEVNRDVTLIPV